MSSRSKLVDKSADFCRFRGLQGKAFNLRNVLMLVCRRWYPADMLRGCGVRILEGRIIVKYSVSINRPDTGRPKGTRNITHSRSSLTFSNYHSEKLPFVYSCK